MEYEFKGRDWTLWETWSVSLSSFICCNKKLLAQLREKWLFDRTIDYSIFLFLYFLSVVNLESKIHIIIISVREKENFPISGLTWRIFFIKQICIFPLLFNFFLIFALKTVFAITKNKNFFYNITPIYLKKNQMVKFLVHGSALDFLVVIALSPRDIKKYIQIL